MLTTEVLEHPRKSAEKQRETGTSASFRECRSNARCPFTAGVTAVDPVSEADLRSHTTDLSLGGCYVDTMSPFPTESEMNLRLTKNGTSFHAKARVVYYQTGRGMGLLFTEVAPAQRLILERWLAELRDESPHELSAAKMEEEDNSSSPTAPKSGERYVIEELVVLLIQKHLLTEDEGETILRRLSE